jgi:hypothetical protein
MVELSTFQVQSDTLIFNKSTGAFDPIAPSSTTEMNDALDSLERSKNQWINLGLEHKIKILDQLMEDFNHVAKDWVDLSLQAKGVPKNSFGEGEEWFNIAISNRLIRLYRSTLEEIKKQGVPSIPGPITTNLNGQLSVQVFPQTYIDRLLLLGTTCQIIMPPGINQDELLENQASVYRREQREGKITLVLGAGNTSFLIPGDILAKLFGEGHVIIFKPNPINEYLGPLVEYAFRSLIEPGYMRVIYGGAQQGAYLSHHDLVADLHMTGSHHTFETIVFGPGEEGAQHKTAREPQLNKRFTAELGNILSGSQVGDPVPELASPGSPQPGDQGCIFPGRDPACFLSRRRSSTRRFRQCPSRCHPGRRDIAWTPAVDLPYGCRPHGCRQYLLQRRAVLQHPVRDRPGSRYSASIY